MVHQLSVQKIKPLNYIGFIIGITLALTNMRISKKALSQPALQLLVMWAFFIYDFRYRIISLATYIQAHEKACSRHQPPLDHKAHHDYAQSLLMPHQYPKPDGMDGVRSLIPPHLQQR